jgi:hypothetical protein
VNVFTYRNHYNGGGVAIGDLTGDGLPEIVLTANQDGPRLYLNRGAFAFRDVTKAAGMEGNGWWTTGVAIADVNGDGRLDVYVCHAGRSGGRGARANQLFINEGVGADSTPRFSEQGARYGLADGGFSTHAAFLDFDRDGDLDLFLVNNSPRPVTSFGLQNTRRVRDRMGGAKLYRNDGAKFADVSASAGIFSPEIAFGLGVGVSDVNRDGWPDIYVANDFFERDYLYLNTGRGAFTEVLDRQMPYSSYFSMGLDIADVNNDGWPDVYTTDMLPEDEYRLRTTSMFEGWDLYQAKVANGYHFQFMRNMLQRNNGDGTFSDIGQMAGVARTDWSWSALLADFDLDGWKDIFVTNGLARDVTSQDYINSLANQTAAERVFRGEKVDFLALVTAMSSTKISNYAFRNTGSQSFANHASAWGLDTPAFSNGAAYGDLDGDGTLDLVVNNVNDEAFVYRNNARRLRGHRFLQLSLAGPGGNPYAVGARVTVTIDSTEQVQELYPSRGFQSSVDYTLTFGVGTRDTVDAVAVTWPDGRLSELRRVATNQRLRVDHASQAAAPRALAQDSGSSWLEDVTATSGVDVRHRENAFVDFDRDRMVPRLLSTEGPMVAAGDVNGDGRDDFYVGGAKEQPGALFVQSASGRFTRANPAVFAADSVAEDLGAAFFDANGDGALDLYVVSGGNEFSEDSPALQDRLYVNDGRGGFSRSNESLPAETQAGSRVVAADYDGDGDQDLFVGGRLVPWHYGRSPRSLLLRNNGRGRFTDVTSSLAPELERAGMVTDAAWVDTDRDGRLDLVVVGDWMPITVFRNAGAGKLVREVTRGLEASEGWWTRIITGDFTGDGQVDLVVGNFGVNQRLQAGKDTPVSMHVGDFVETGFDLQILASYSGGKRYPVALRDEMIRAIPSLKGRYLTWADYATQTLRDVFPESVLAAADERVARTFVTSIAVRNADGSYTLTPLPAEAQLAPVFGILADDVNGDSRPDLLLGGNFGGFKPDLGKMQAGYGLVLTGHGAGFSPVPARRSGLRVSGEVRDIARLRTDRGPVYLVTRNNDAPVLLRRRAGGHQ